MNVVIDHIGVVVRSLEAAIPGWVTTFGYEQMTEPVLNTRQKVRVVFLGKEGSTTIKLVEPTDRSSSVFALSARGGGLHHLCFRADDMAGAMQHLEREKARVLVPPEPGEAFENEPIAFVFVHGLAAEIIATQRKAKPLPRPAAPRNQDA
jgi:methylmalonyl-CoA/ethylmalonyl-CoA epimerase